MSLRKLPEIFRRASEARASMRRRSPEELGHQMNRQFAYQDCFRRPVLLRSCRRGSRHRALFCEALENAEAATDALETVRPRPSTAPWGFCRSRTEVALKTRPPKWLRANRPGQSLFPAPSLNQKFCAFRFEPETDFH